MSDHFPQPLERYTDKVCHIHLYHSPRPEYTERHHVLPLAWGGEDVPENTLLVCPTGHTNIHRLLKYYEDYNGKPPWTVRIGFSSAERRLAERAWNELRKTPR